MSIQYVHDRALVSLLDRRDEMIRVFQVEHVQNKVRASGENAWTTSRERWTQCWQRAQSHGDESRKRHCTSQAAGAGPARAPTAHRGGSTISHVTNPARRNAAPVERIPGSVPSRGAVTRGMMSASTSARTARRRDPENQPTPRKRQRQPRKWKLFFTADLPPDAAGRDHPAEARARPQRRRPERELRGRFIG